MFSLFSTAPQVLSTSSPAQQAENEAKASSSVLINESEPTTNIQIRLADGGRLVQKFNHSHRYLISAVFGFLAVSQTSAHLQPILLEGEVADLQVWCRWALFLLLV